MSATTVLTTVAYDTTLDVISKIGAMFSVLFALFAMYYLNFNKSDYYVKNTHMANFDDKISPLVSATQRLRSQTIRGEKTEEEKKEEEAKDPEKPLTNWLQNVVKTRF